MPFRFKAEARLRQYLGEYDALVELNELAVRYFVDSAQKTGDVRSFVDNASASHGVRVNADSLDDLRLNTAKTHILVVYQSADQFLAEFEREHCWLHQRAWKGQGKEKKSPLERVLEEVAGSYGEGQRVIGKAQESVFEYYRQVRNLITHRDDPTSEEAEDNLADSEDVGKRTKQLESMHKGLHNRFLDEIKETFGLEGVPHRFNELTFDDFILYSRNLKLIAERLSLCGRPRDPALLSAIDESIQRFLRHDRNNLPRVQRRIAGKLKTRFGLDQEEALRIASGWHTQVAH
jgi:hypothetical protein